MEYMFYRNSCAETLQILESQTYKSQIRTYKLYN